MKFLTLTLLLLAPSVALASDAVFHSPTDDGVPAGSSVLLPDGTHSIYLYAGLTGTPSVGPDPCGAVDDGDDICFWNIDIQATAGVTLLAFTPTGDVVSNLEANRLRANGDVVGGAPSPLRLGELQIQVAGGAGNLTAEGVHLVRAGQVRNDVAQAVLVPEPASALMLGCGAAALLGLFRARSKR